MAPKILLRVVKWVVVLALLAGGAYYGYRWYQQHQQAQVPGYKTVLVVRGDLTQAVTATGTLNPVLNVQVGSQISGMIQKLHVDYNSPVKSGQIVAELDPATYLATVHQNEGDLANANAALELTQLNARRAAELLKGKLIAQSEADKAIADLHQAEAAVLVQKATLERAKVDLARCTIAAPIDGIVISRNVDVGQTVAASLSAPILFVIANDLTRMQIDANVSEADIGGVETGQTVNFTVDAFPTRTFTGKVVQIRNAPITVQNVVTYDTVIEVSNQDLKLKPGMTANVSIITAQREGVLKVPNAAFRFRPPENQDVRKAGSTNTAPAQVAGVKGGISAPGAGGAGRVKRSVARTIYALVHHAADPAGKGATVADEIKPLSVREGISDGTFTEIIEGVAEGDAIITGLAVPAGSSPAATPSNPFGGGMRRM